MNKFQSLFLIFFPLFLAMSCGGNQVYKDKWAKKIAPEEFKARFETTKGNFELQAKRQWSPEGVDRLYQLIESGFYTEVALFRVVPNFVAQFGIHNDSLLNKSWKSHKIKDEPVVQKNIKGAISFARGGKESRTTQLFINLKSNSPRLDTLNYNGVKGFPVVAKVISGMDIIESFYGGYAEVPGRKQEQIVNEGNAYLKENFPKLDYIKKAYIID